MSSEWTEEYSLEGLVHPLDLLQFSIDHATGCWNFIGNMVGTKTHQYGEVFISGNRGAIYAHRLAYELYIGEIPHRMCVCHRCDNPQCVNPKHLFLGSHKDNTQDAIRKGRFTQHLHPGFLKKKA